MSDNLSSLGTIYCADSISVLRSINPGTVHLIYVDPPFRGASGFQQLTVNSTPKTKRTKNTIAAYINWLRDYVLQLRRVLHDKGSLYWHSDVFDLHRIRLLLDEIFGETNFKSQIIWQQDMKATNIKRRFPNTYEAILYYTKSEEYVFNPQYTNLQSGKHVYSYDRQEEDTGRRYRLVDLTAKSGSAGNTTFDFLGVTRSWKWSKEKLHKAYQEGLIVQPKPGAVPMLKQYLDESTPLGDIWTDIPTVRGFSEEGTGYPTQKPLALLERIISTSSNKGDLVLDPFCGSGTSVVAAHKLERRWIGVDISPNACRIAANRLIDEGLEASKGFRIIDLPKTVEDLQGYDASEFESWAVIAINTVFGAGHTVGKARGDQVFVASEEVDVVLLAEDAVPHSAIPIEVKQRDNVNGNDIRRFAAILKNAKVRRGIYVALGYEVGAVATAKLVAEQDGINIELLAAEDILKEQGNINVDEFS